MEISPNLYGRMDGSKFWCFPWFPENSSLCVILRYTVYVKIRTYILVTNKLALLTGTCQEKSWNQRPSKSEVITQFELAERSQNLKSLTIEIVATDLKISNNGSSCKFLCPMLLCKWRCGIILGILSKVCSKWQESTMEGENQNQWWQNCLGRGSKIYWRGTRRWPNANPDESQHRNLERMKNQIYSFRAAGTYFNMVRTVVLWWA